MKEWGDDQVEIAAEAFRNALTGEVEPLRRIGMSFKMRRWQWWLHRWSRRYRLRVQRKILREMQAQ
jgi:hypothetical protein